MRAFLTLVAIVLFVLWILSGLTGCDPPTPTDSPLPTLTPTSTPTPTSSPASTAMVPSPTSTLAPLPTWTSTVESVLLVETEPTLEGMTDEITSDAESLIALTGLASFASAIVMVLSYFNIAKDRWGGKIFVLLGLCIYGVTKTLPAEVYNPLFEFLDLLGRMVLLALSGIGLHAGTKYIGLKPQRRGVPSQESSLVVE